MMSQDTRVLALSPTTRVEGHGKVTIHLDEFGNVSHAFFHATELRGFEKFLLRMEADRVPAIISRVCGVCSVAHHLASVKAIEDVYRVEVTETAKKLRELLLMGQMLSSHALSLFFLTLPDFYFGVEEDPSKRNIFEIMRRDPEIGKRALFFISLGGEVIQTLGGRPIHPVAVVLGGMLHPLSEADRASLLKKVEDAISMAKKTVLRGKRLFEDHMDEIRRFAVIKTHYMGLTQGGTLNFYDGMIRIIDPDRRTVTDHNPIEYPSLVEEKTLEWTYAKFSFLQEYGWPAGILKVNSLARANVVDDVPTPLAREEAREFYAKFGRPAHETLLFDYARMIELLYTCERMKELLEDEEITRRDVRVRVEPREGMGIGVVEAPRGTLVHQYTIDREGRMRRIHLTVPTNHNNAAINMSVKDVAYQFIRGGKVRPELLDRVEMVIRAYDPCISCATHTANNRYVSQVEVRDHRGNTIENIYR
ncbi:MAG: Ni/Fe hydrogenase subunit alpha [Candidatus Bathyarchaeia archaeon]